MATTLARTNGALQPAPPQQPQQQLQPGGGGGPAAGATSAQHKLALLNEDTWLQLGKLAETLREPSRALYSYEAALRHNPYCAPALAGAGALYRALEQYPKAAECYNRVLALDQTNGDAWGALGHCHLMVDDLQKAYSAYQQALYHLANPKDPKLWYGIGILYDRYGSFEHSEEAFAAVLNMDPHYEKASEVYFRLGIIYKQQAKYDKSLECFRYILANPPKPLSDVDILFQIGQVQELQKDYSAARETYERVLKEHPTHARVLQQLGWLTYQTHVPFHNLEASAAYLSRSLEADMNDPQTWYFLGRAYMQQQKYNKAYDAYQQAVYRDGRNAVYWCSIGVLYFQINQYRDALDAYSRAIKINPGVAEVWFDLGSLYESCNNQVQDALDAYSKAIELDPSNDVVKQRISILQSARAQGTKPNSPPPPPVHPPVQEPRPGHQYFSAGGSSTTASPPGAASQPPAPQQHRPSLTQGGPPQGPQPGGGPMYNRTPSMGHVRSPPEMTYNDPARRSYEGGYRPGPPPNQQQQQQHQLPAMQRGPSGPGQQQQPLPSQQQQQQQGRPAYAYAPQGQPAPGQYPPPQGMKRVLDDDRK